jgi:hypothetical protein
VVAMVNGVPTKRGELYATEVVSVLGKDSSFNRYKHHP